MKLVSKRIGLGLVIFLAFGLAISAIIRYLLLDPASTNKTLIEQGMELYDFHYQPWNIVLLFHIVTASLAIVIGPFQFFKKIRIKRKNLHRNLGKIYITTILISGITGVYLSFYAFGGIISKIGFFTLSIAWLYTTYLAYRHVRNKQFKLHENWMYRSYAVTFVAITFRFWSAVIGYSFDNFQLGYTVAIWVSLIGNLVVMEFWLKRKSSKIKSSRPSIISQ
ncbi:DUF2306 domain-containing protein [Pseudoneobacillus rhizosphaerae]|uniref:DUF2306 domain-containing protein n=1 Tax=Pseudoneobacillus rhizosphaerae TaxID=2880968 RepID=A0A9C7LA41_9BACI|nr:DUF2306 domain-containing protein [Pseudoneobacillus rhizosphaerae]CAG9608731.1 hypothetical protein NEOCIP111885_02448 [Pseudoneobacillus rhizosphaerae]